MILMPSGPVTALYRSFDLVFCHKGECSWHHFTARGYVNLSAHDSVCPHRRLASNGDFSIELYLGTSGEYSAGADTSFETSNPTYSDTVTLLSCFLGLVLRSRIIGSGEWPPELRYV